MDKKTWINRDAHYGITYEVPVEKDSRLNVCMWHIWGWSLERCCVNASVLTIKIETPIGVKEFKDLIKNLQMSGRNVILEIIKIQNLITRHLQLLNMELLRLAIVWNFSSGKTEEKVDCARSRGNCCFLPVEFHALSQSIKAPVLVEFYSQQNRERVERIMIDRGEDVHASRGGK